MSEAEGSRNNVQRLVVPIGMVVGAITMTVIVLYGIDERIDQRVEEALYPIRANQQEVLRKLDEVRQTVARIEGRMDFITRIPPN